VIVLIISFVVQVQQSLNVITVTDKRRTILSHKQLHCYDGAINLINLIKHIHENNVAHCPKWHVAIQLVVLKRRQVHCTSVISPPVFSPCVRRMAGLA